MRSTINQFWSFQRSLRLQYEIRREHAWMQEDRSITKAMLEMIRLDWCADSEIEKVRDKVW
jgi:hypothetical protein